MLLSCEIHMTQELKAECWKAKENWWEDCHKFKAWECNQMCTKEDKENYKRKCKEEWEDYKASQLISDFRWWSCYCLKKAEEY